MSLAPLPPRIWDTKVELEETIATGQSACLVVVHLRPTVATLPTLVILRFRLNDVASNRFVLLNRQLSNLTREVRARRVSDEALLEVNACLQDQTLKVELTNQQLKSQAMELAQQIEEAQALAFELGRANAGFAAAAAARSLAEQANRTKSEFLAVMSHELRTPLNAIGGYVELLELGIRGPATEEQREDLARIQRSQRHLLALINDVLNFARLEAGHVHYHGAVIDVDGLLRDVEPLIAPQIKAQRLSYACEDVAASVMVRADPEKLQQVLLNLLSNAVKFTPMRGTVTLSAECVGEGSDACVRIHVRDTGVGIAPDKLERIFEPFVQLDQSLTRPHEGVGLGLAISRDLIRGMDGDLTAESSPDCGSVFTVTLPAGN